jgi:phospholipid/cholesterol/gamma-HCH transport system permease protein
MGFDERRASAAQKPHSGGRTADEWRCLASSPSWVVLVLSQVGQQLVAFTSYIGQTAQLQWEVLVGLAKGKLEYGLTVSQMAYVGVASLPVVAVTMLFSGMVITYHMAIVTGQLGVSNYVGRVVAETMSRELGPVLVSFVVAARAGSAMAAELGTMKVTEQIDALRAMATNPVDYLALPRWVACALMVPALTFVGDIVGVFGGYLVSVTNPLLNSAAYWSNIPGSFQGSTLVAGVGKSLVFGLIIAIVSCHQGLSCRMASEEVGRATTRAVVYSIMLVYAADLFLTTLIFRG